MCIYIASPSFSGSTLLTILLGAHPDIATIGEMKGGQEDLATYICSCGALFTKCVFWARLIGALAERGFIYDLGDRRTMPAFRMPGSPVGDRFMRHPYGTPTFELLRRLVFRCWPGCSRRLDYLRRYNETFIDLVLQLQGASIFVDSSKDPNRISYLAGIPSLQLYVLHLVRDGRGVVNSTRKNLGMSVHDASIEWRDTHLEIERIVARFCTGRTLRVCYEDLCIDPDRVLSAILAFAGASGTAPALEATEPEIHVLGNRMRLRGALPIRVDESWKSDMSDEDLALFTSTAGPLNARYGYRVSNAESFLGMKQA